MNQSSSNTTIVQSSVPKLEGKKNYRNWNLRIRPLLKSKGKLAAIEYVPRLKSSSSKKDLADIIIEALAKAKHLRKADITSPDQREVPDSGIVKVVSIPLLLDSTKPGEGDEDDDNKSTDSWRYHKNNDGAVFTLTSHLANHILTKV